MNISIEEMPREIARLEEENELLQDRIDKAIEYIEKWLFEAGGNGACMNYDDIEDIREILKGSDK